MAEETQNKKNLIDDRKITLYEKDTGKSISVYKVDAKEILNGKNCIYTMKNPADLNVVKLDDKNDNIELIDQISDKYTKKELDEKAKELNIEGFKSMNKTTLINELIKSGFSE